MISEGALARNKNAMSQLQKSVDICGKGFVKTNTTTFYGRYSYTDSETGKMFYVIPKFVDFKTVIADSGKERVTLCMDMNKCMDMIVTPKYTVSDYTDSMDMAKKYAVLRYAGMSGTTNDEDILKADTTELKKILDGIKERAKELEVILKRDAEYRVNPFSKDLVKLQIGNYIPILCIDFEKGTRSIIDNSSKGVYVQSGIGMNINWGEAGVSGLGWLLDGNKFPWRKIEYKLPGYQGGESGWEGIG